MPDITITLTSAQVARIGAAFRAEYGGQYDPDSQLSNLDIARLVLQDRLADITLGHERRVAAEAARGGIAPLSI